MNKKQKEKAKETKKLQIEAVTAEAMLKQIISKSQINTEYHQREDETSLIIPLGDSGIEIGLPNNNVVKWKAVLPDFLTQVSNGISNEISIRELEQYCNKHNLHIVSDKARKYCVLPNGLKVISGGMLCHHKWLISVDIPSSVKQMGRDVFLGCDSLQNITFDGTIAQWEAIKGKSALATLPITTVKCSDGNADMTLIVEDNVLIGCNVHVVSVSIPNDVKKIGDWAFGYCSQLVSVEIPDGVTEIGSWAFGWCTSLQSVTIPKSVKKIGDNAFVGCDLLQNISFCGSKDQLQQIKKIKSWFKCDTLFKIHCADGDIEVGKVV